MIQIQDVEKLVCSIPATGSHDTFQSVKVGEVPLNKGAEVTLRMLPVADAWHPVNTRQIKLAPQP